MHEETRQLMIIHLSDVHFGHRHRFDPPPAPQGGIPGRAGYPTLLQKLREDLAISPVDVPYAAPSGGNYVAGNASDTPVLVCITGDFAEAATIGEFRQAETFVEGLIAEPILGQPVTKDRLLIVPGNHDVVFDSLDMGERLQQWVEFYNRIYGTNHRRESPLEMVRLHKLADIGALVLTLNSSMYVQKGSPEQDRGHLDVEQLGHIEDALEQIAPQDLESYIRIALVHHHPVLIPSLAEPGRGYDAVLNSGKLLTILRRYGFHLLLHGHKHNPHTFTDDSRGAFGNTSHQPIHIVAGGSAGSTSLPESPKQANTYNRILVKWHPAAGQSRIIVQTRALSVFREDGTERLPGRWRWNTLDEDDRSFYDARKLPPVKETRHSAYDANAFREWEQERKAQYDSCRRNLPVIEVIPSATAGQAYEARVWIVPHRGREPEDIPLRVTWSAGPMFPTTAISVNDDPAFCTAFDYWGPMLIQGRLEFADGPPACVYIYARLPQRYPAIQEDDAP